MSYDYKRMVPQILASVFIIVLIIEYILPEGPLVAIRSEASLWLTIIGGLSIIGGTGMLLIKYGKNLTTTKEDKSTQIDAVVFFIVFFVYLGVAIGMGGVGGDAYNWLYQFINGNFAQARWLFFVFLEPWAAYRAFRIRSIEALILAISGLSYLLYTAPTIPALVPWIGELSTWIINVPSKGGSRAATICMAVGSLILGYRILTGKERGIND